MLCQLDLLFVAYVISSLNTFVCYLDLSNFLLESRFRILEFYQSISCMSILSVLQDVIALICVKSQWGSGFGMSFVRDYLTI